MVTNRDDKACSDNSSSLPPPSPPPTAEIGVQNTIITGGIKNGTAPSAASAAAPKTEDEKYKEHLMVFKHLSLFSTGLNRSSRGKDSDKDLKSFDVTNDVEADEDNDSVEVPLGSMIDQSFRRRNDGSKQTSRSMKCMICAVVILLIIMIVLSVGFSTGGFSGGGTGSGGSGSGGGDNTDKGSPTSPDEAVPNFTPDTNEPERYARLREYLMSVGANGDATFNDPISPESQALAWMQSEDPAQLDPIKINEHLRIDQRYALLTVWFQSDMNWLNETNWLSDDECEWFGVTCFVVTPRFRRKLSDSIIGNNDQERKLQDGDRLVALVDLEHNNIQGQVPSDLYLLKFLKTLNLSNNQLTGPVPTSLSQMAYLEELYLDNNDLTGQMMTDFTRLDKMRVLDLSLNQIAGSIPDSMWNVTSLREIRLDGNMLSGTISESASNLQSLVHFSAGGNAFDNGALLPTGFFSIPTLETLLLNDCGLSGQIPATLADTVLLRSIDLSNNRLDGQIPDLNALVDLNSFIVSGNQLSGQVFGLNALVNLETVVLESNAFSGPLPLFRLSSNIKILRLGGNNFESRGFPPYLLTVTSLTDLGLNDCGLTGEIPQDGFEAWSDMLSLRLDGNNFSGEIPSSLALLPQLEILFLSSNQLNSTLPEEFGGMTSLRVLDVSDNSLSGSLPASVTSLTALELLDVSENNMFGILPSEVGNMAALRELDISSNMFAGILPPSIANLGRLEVFNANSNFLQGSIPSGVNGMTSLVRLDLSFNLMSGKIPESIEDIPPLQELRLGNNANVEEGVIGFEGTIPASFSNLNQLRVLEINMNNISGELPTEHSVLRSLQIYDVSDNPMLGGGVPSEYVGMESLVVFNIRGTNIEGPVPEGLCETDVVVEISCDAGLSQCSCCGCST